MSNTTIFYLLSALGCGAHIYAIWLKRTTTTLEWIKDGYNQSYLGVTVLACVVFVLVGPGDGADLGSNAVRMNAFAYAGLGAEVIRTSILGPKRMSERKAAKAEKANPEEKG